MSASEFHKAAKAARKIRERAEERQALRAAIDARVVDLAQQFFGIMHAMVLTNQPAVEPQKPPVQAKPVPRKPARRRARR
jgi:hypothetical protein